MAKDIEDLLAAGEAQAQTGNVTQDDSDLDALFARAEGGTPPPPSAPAPVTPSPEPLPTPQPTLAAEQFGPGAVREPTLFREDLDSPAQEVDPVFAPALAQGFWKTVSSFGQGLVAGSIPQTDPDTDLGRFVRDVGPGVVDIIKKNIGESLRDIGRDEIANNPEWNRSENLTGRSWTENLQDPQTRGEYLTRVFGENLPGVIGGLGSAVAGFAAGGAPGSLMAMQQFSSTVEGGHSFEELIDMGVPEDQATDTAQTVGIISSILETAPIGIIFNKVPGLKQAFGRFLTKEVVAEPLTRQVVKSAVAGAVAEGATEGLQEIVQNVGQKFYDENVDLLEGVGESAFIGSLFGGAIGTGAPLVAPSANTAKEKNERPTAELNKDAITMEEQVAAAEELNAFKADEPITPMNVSSDPATMEALQEDEIGAEVSREQRRYPNVTDFKAAMRKADVPIEDTVMDNLTGKLDNYGRGKGFWNTLTQTANKNPHIAGLGKPQVNGRPGYMQLNQIMSGVKHDNELATEKVVKDWNALGPKDAQDLSDLLLEVSEMSHLQEKRISPDQITELAKEKGMSFEALEMYDAVDGHFRQMLDQLEQLETGRIMRKLQQEDTGTGDIDADVEADLKQLKESMQELRNRNFFPWSRYGNHLVTVFAKQAGEFNGRKFQKGQVILQEAYETEKQAKEAAAEIEKSNVGRKHSVGIGFRREKETQFAGMPTAMLSAIRQNLSLNQEQTDALNNVVEQFMPGQGYRKRLLKKKGVAGYSRDAIRAYSSYALQFGRFAAKLTVNDDMQSAIDTIAASSNEIQRQGGDGTNRMRIVNDLQTHKNYIMNPQSEWDFLGSLSFMHYLAGIPEKVFLNTLQLPAVVYPVLAAKYGDAKALTEMTKAIKQVWQGWKSPEKLDPHFREALAEGVRQKVLDQSFAAEAAAASESTNLDRMIPFKVGGSTARETWFKLTEVGSWMFTKSEQYVRRIAFTAAWNLEMQKSKDPVKAWVAAKNATRDGAFEFSQWNRPKFMRGKAKPFFIFAMHIQQMMDFVFQNNPAAWRALGILFLMAGVNGLPGSEDAQEVINFVFKQINKHTGKEMLPHDVQQWARDLIKDGLDDPDGMITDLILNGAGKYGFGTGFIGAEDGVPYSSTDVSGSISLGRIPLATGLFQALNSPSWEKATATALGGTAGAGFSIPLAALKVASQDEPDLLKSAQAVAPKFIANPLKALELYQRDGSTYRGGVVVPGTQFDITNPDHAVGLVAQALGFPLTRVNVARERDWTAFENVYYWRAKKQYLMMQYEHALRAKDAREAEADVRKRLSRFNDDVPYPEMMINKKKLKASIKARIRQRELRRLGLPTGRSEIRLQESIQETFPVPVDFENVPKSNQ